MGIFRKWFGGKSQAESKATPPARPAESKSGRAPAAPNSAEPGSPNDGMVHAVDKHGNPIWVLRKDWYENVELTQSQQRDPDALFQHARSALEDGYPSHAEKWARRLLEIEGDSERGTCLLGVALIQQEQVDATEKLFSDYVDKHGETGAVLFNLAQIREHRGEQAEAERLYWHAIEIDPNQQAAFGWQYEQALERGGEAAVHELLLKVAALPGSWRARLWLARQALEQRQLGEAMRYYREALSMAGQPAPAETLQQISGDLGQAGHLEQVLELVGPKYDARYHGLEVGNNLIKAHLDLGHVDAARRICEQLHGFKRPDWKQTLAFWDMEIQKARLQARPVAAKQTMTGLMIEGPVWLADDAPASVFGSAKRSDEVLVFCMGSSVTYLADQQASQVRQADEGGRLSRALPLFLAEQVHFGSEARVQLMIPWMKPAGAFAVLGQAIADEQVVHLARRDERPADYVVAVHVTQANEEHTWRTEVRLLRTADGERVATLEAPIDLREGGRQLQMLGRRLRDALIGQGVASRAIPGGYQTPDASGLANYLLRLEQLLAVRCETMQERRDGGLNGEREIMEGNIALCERQPTNATTRMVLARTVRYMRKVRPDVVREFQDDLLTLDAQCPLSGEMDGLMRRTLSSRE